MHIPLLKKSWPGIVALLLTLLLAPRTSLAQGSSEVTANDDDAWTDYATPVWISVTDNDYSDPDPIDPASVEIVTEPVGGTVDVDPLTGDVLYTPDTSYWGFDSFSYRFADTSGVLSSEANVYIDVAEPLPPFAEDDYFETGFRESQTFDLLENDWGFEGPIVPYSVVITSEPSYGSVVNNFDGTVTYSPDPDIENEEDNFSYTVEDVYGNVSDEGYVYISIGENGKPSMTLEKDHVQGDTWTFWGFVSDDQTVEGLTVNLSGSVPITDVVTDSYGFFSVDLDVDGPYAEVFGVATDVADKESDEVSVLVE
jgi:hypothetical protein